MKHGVWIPLGRRWVGRVPVVSDPADLVSFFVGQRPRAGELFWQDQRERAIQHGLAGDRRSGRGLRAPSGDRALDQVATYPPPAGWHAGRRLVLGADLDFE